MTPDRFKEIRAGAKISQIRLGALLGLHELTIRGYEKGKNAIPIPVALSMELLSKEGILQFRRLITVAAHKPMPQDDGDGLRQWVD